jgi:hypothetical protein
MSDDGLTYDPSAPGGNHFPNHGKLPPVISPLGPEFINPPGSDGLTYHPHEHAAATPSTSAPDHSPNAPVYRQQLADGRTYMPTAQSDPQAEAIRGPATPTQTVSFASPAPKKAQQFNI